MIYELQEIVQAFKKMDTKLQRGAYTQEEIQEQYESIQECSQLLDAIKQYTSALENTDVNDVNTMLECLADLDATLRSCTDHVKAKSGFIRKFSIRFSNDEIIE